MKKSFLLALSATLCIILTSCGSDGRDAKPSNQLIGHWNGSKEFDAEYKNEVIVDSETTYIVPPDFYTLIFNQDGSVTADYSIMGEKGHETGEYLIKGDSLTLSGMEDAPENDQYYFQISGKVLEIVNVGYDTSEPGTSRSEEHLFFTKQ